MKKSMIVMRFLLCLVAVCCFTARLPTAANAQSAFNNQTASFLGTWCAQGRPGLRASITAAGLLNVNLTNENGSASTGYVFGPNSRQIAAPQWNLVQGSLSADGQTIRWSNNTFWTRCDRHAVDLEGTWFAGGTAGWPCRIVQRNGELFIRNEIGQTGSGSFNSRNQIVTLWSGTLISGAISSDQNRIDWSNGTYWTR